MHINLNKLETGDKVAFSERVEKTVSNICRDNGETRSVSFDDGIILNWDNSLWELAELPRSGVIWEETDYGTWEGYETEYAKSKGLKRFLLVEDENREFLLREYSLFPSEQSAKAHANRCVKSFMSDDGY